MPFGRGFGFRGWSPPWPYVGWGRGGLPRCWAYAPFWGAPYSYPFGIGVYPHGWGMGFPSPYYGPTYPYGYSPTYSYGPGSWVPPFGSPVTPEAEKEWLKSQAESLKQQIDQINSRIMELEKNDELVKS